MFVGGVNFILVYNAVSGQWRQLWGNGVFRNYLVIVAAAFILIARVRFWLCRDMEVTER